MSRRALRLAAIAIAVFGIIDPVVTVSRPAPQLLTITILGSSGDAAHRVARQLQTSVADRFDVRIRAQRADTDASPCPAAGACVVVSDGATSPRRLMSEGPLGAIRIDAARPAVAITRIDTPSSVDRGARGTIEVALDVKDASQDPMVRVFDGAVQVGQSTRRRIEWTPVAAGLRDLRVTTADDEAHVAVEVRSVQYRVLFYEPRPTWSGTFVRRALEADPRFLVRGRATVARNLTVSTADTPLDSATLERMDPHVVVVSASEQLTSREAAVLERFTVRRGGTVVALLDRPPAGASRALIPFVVTERRERQPVSIGALKASEFLTFAATDPVTSVIASAGDAPVIVSRPAGNGRLVASGASDAWRFRGEGGAFTAFWQSLVADGGAAAGEPVAVTLDKRLARPYERVRVSVEWRPLGGVAASIEARGVVSCGHLARPIRLWPDGAPGRFEGEFVPPAAGECRVTTSLNAASGSTLLLVRDRRTVSEANEGALAAAIAAHGGTVVDAGDENALVTALRRSASRTSISAQVHPLRSPWWIVPFAAGLGGEWWMRRRSGLK